MPKVVVRATYTFPALAQAPRLQASCPIQRVEPAVSLEEDRATLHSTTAAKRTSWRVALRRQMRCLEPIRLCAYPNDALSAAGGPNERTKSNSSTYS